MAKRYQDARKAPVQEAPKPIAAAPAPLLAPAVQPMKLDFDAWWAMNEKKIPSQHHKEIIKAEFRARGLSLKEPAQSYNEALKKYGVKLK